MKKISILFSFLLLFVFFFVGSTYASENNLPAVPDGDLEGPNRVCFIFKQFDGTINLYIFQSSVDLKIYKYDDNMITIKYFGSNYVMYGKKKLDNNQWVNEATGSLVRNNTINISMTGQFEIIRSDMDIRMSENSDEIFFPPAPTPPTPETPTVAEMIAEETPIMGEKIIQAMKIILLCGIGCLALLIGLPILLKVLYRFL